MTDIVPLSAYRHRKGRIYFTRAELSRLLSLYSGRVACGEWRDYAIDHRVGLAVFSVFRHSLDRPLYAIAKTVTPGGPEYAVFEGPARVVRSTELQDVIAWFGPSLSIVTD